MVMDLLLAMVCRSLLCMLWVQMAISIRVVARMNHMMLLWLHMMVMGIMLWHLWLVVIMR